jgi:diguanylate cyclase (GGDEF)-like protein
MNTQETKNLYRFYLLMVVLSLGLILVYQLFPNRTLTILPGGEFDIYSSADSDEGGNSEARFLDPSYQNWYCHLKPSPSLQGFPSCRLGIAFSKTPNDWTQGIDLSGFSDLKIVMDYRGTASFMRLHFRDFDPDLSNKGDYNSAKFANIIIRDPGPDSEYSINLAEFKLADWWVQQFSIPSDQAIATLKRVTSFEIDFAEPVPYGEHTIAIKKIELVGQYISAENWYLSILAGWMVMATAVGIYRLVDLNKISRRQAKHIQEMRKFADDLKQQSINYKNLSRHDQLTGVMNRLGLQEIIESSFEWRTQKNKIALLIIDLDHFKKINDTQGHEVGDEVLKAIGAALSRSTRAEDSVARWGGEEFLVLSPNTPREGAMIMAEKLRKEITLLDFRSRGITQITASLGVTIIDHEENFETALNRADQALYDAKSSGRNCWVFH